MSGMGYRSKSFNCSDLVSCPAPNLSHLSGNRVQYIVLYQQYDMCHHPSGSPHQIMLCHLTQISLNISQPPLMPVGVVSTWLRFLWSKESDIILSCIYM